MFRQVSIVSSLSVYAGLNNLTAMQRAQTLIDIVLSVDFLAEEWHEKVGEEASPAERLRS